MLFNSYEFILVFCPVTLLGYVVLGRYASASWALTWLIIASVGFYAWWNPINLLLISPSIALNFLAARGLRGLRGSRPRAAQALLILSIAGNLAFLSYFKYRNFGFSVINDTFGTNFIFEQLVLPLGISFITFQKIAFLVDVHAERIKSFNFHDYCLFVLFFPQLIAGPIVHYREMMPQFATTTGRIAATDLFVGVCLFSIGLFKKAILADGIAQYVSPIYAAAGGGKPVTAIYAWLAAIGFTLQIYFDFSGYSDMALGVARFFGVKLPMNFNSPLKASSIIDFWSRWHATLTRFLTAYVYNPIALAATRRRLSNKRPGISGPKSTPGAILSILLFPTLFTMFLSGLWHGAGYQYIVWGLLHGCYLSINHIWRLFRPRAWADRLANSTLSRYAGVALTFGAVVVAMVFFRAPTVHAAIAVLEGMIGINGVAVPVAVANRLRELGVGANIVSEWTSGRSFSLAIIWTACLLTIAWVMPNSLQLLGRYEPALGFPPSGSMKAVPAGGNENAVSGKWWLLELRPTALWAVAIGIMATAGILALSQPSEFLYWQF